MPGEMVLSLKGILEDGEGAMGVYRLWSWREL